MDTTSNGWYIWIWIPETPTFRNQMQVKYEISFAEWANKLGSFGFLSLPSGVNFLLYNKQKFLGMYLFQKKIFWLQKNCPVKVTCKGTFWKAKVLAKFLFRVPVPVHSWLIMVPYRHKKMANLVEEGLNQHLLNIL